MCLDEDEAKEDATIEAYDEIAEKWARKYDTEKYWGLYFDMFSSFLPKGRVLEIGCGAGRDAKTLIEMGYQWTGTDPSREMLRVARERGVRGDGFYCASVYQLPTLNLLVPFDGFWASASLLHVPPQRMVHALSVIRSMLRPGGIGFISLKKGTGSEAVSAFGSGDQEELAPPRHFYYYNEQVFEPFLRGARLEPLVAANYKKEQSSTEWLIYFVERKPGS